MPISASCRQSPSSRRRATGSSSPSRSRRASRYKFGKVDITNTLKDVNPAALKPLLTTRAGDWYNADAVEGSITALTDGLGNLGFAFVDIQPQVRRNADTRTIDVTYTIKEGPRVYVERINITGNLRTLDSVIRREFRLVEGDAFNSVEAASLRTEHQEPRFLREGQHHQRARQRARTRPSSMSICRRNRPASSRSASASRPPTARSPTSAFTSAICSAGARICASIRSWRCGTSRSI